MLRIGICAPYDLGRAGGVNTHIRAQAQALRARGHAVCVFGASSTPLSGDERAVSGCISPVIGGTETGTGCDPRAWWRVGRLFERERFDLVHVHEPLMPLVPWCAVWQARMPVVGTFHTYREQGHRFYPRYRAILAPLMRRVGVRIAVSRAACRTVNDDFPGAYLIIPNGIEVNRFANRVPRPAAFEAARPHVLYVGRLEPRKGVEYLLQAMAMIPPPQPQLVVVGDGPGREALLAQAHAGGVDVHFAGRVSDDELPAYYQSADVVCSSAIGDESFGLVLVEAMAAGRPIVATSIAGYLELTENVEAGVRFVPPADAVALAHEIGALMADTALRERLGAEGRRFAARFDWSVVARELEAVYLGLVKPAGPEPQPRPVGPRQTDPVASARTAG